MNKLELEFTGFNEALHSMTINGKYAKIKNIKGKKICTFETNEKVAELSICKTHHYTGKAWFWWNLLYFIVSCFGLFDIRHDKKFVVVDFKATIQLNENSTTNANFKILNFKDNESFAELTTEAEVEIKNNITFYDTEAKKRHKKMTKAKIGIAIPLIITAIVLLIVL